MTSPIPSYSADNVRLDRLLHILVENGFGLLSWEKLAVQKALMFGGEGSVLAERLFKSVRHEFTKQELEEFHGKISSCSVTILPIYFAPHLKAVISMLLEMLNRRP